MVVSVMFTGEFAPLFEILLAIEIMSPKIALDVDLGPAPSPWKIILPIGFPCI